MPSQVQRLPTATSQNDFYGGGTEAWANTDNIMADDDVGATVALPAATVSQELCGRAFGFTVSGTVDGMILELKRQDALAQCEDWIVAIEKSLSGTDSETKGQAGAWPATYDYAAYGSATDTWGQVWTAAQINNTNMCGKISAQTVLAATPDVDVMMMTVHYSPRGGMLTMMGVGALLAALGLAQSIAPMAAYFFAGLAGLTLAWLGRPRSQTRCAGVA